jgi:integrase
MAILAECPGCRKKQSIKNKICSCGENLDKAKQSKRVKYWIDYRLKDGSHNRESLAKFDDVNPYSIEAAKAVLSKRVVQKKEKRIFDIQPEANMTFKELSEWYLENGYQKVHRGMVNKHPEVFEANIKKFNLKFGNLTVSQITAADIQQYQNGRTIAKLRPGTIDLEVGAARAVVNKAFLARKVTQDIVLEFKQVPRLLVRGSNIRKVIVSPEHYEKIYKVIAERSKPIWKILSYEGMREGEVLGLTPDKISLDRHLIKLGAEDTKEKKEKIVPMEDEVYLIISARVNELANQKATGNAKLFNLTKEQFM